MPIEEEPPKKDTYLDIKSRTLETIRTSQKSVSPYKVNDTTTTDNGSTTFNETKYDTGSIDTNSTINDFKAKMN
jgi:hypothetical protein